MPEPEPGPVSRAVAEALKAAPPEDRDAGAVALCVRYAQLLDEAAPAARYRKPLELLQALANDSTDKAAEAFEVVRTALSEHSVASDLGPKLLAALTSLGLTVAGRSKTIKETPDAPAVPGKAALEGIRDEVSERRAGRERRAAAVDPSAP